MKLHTLCAVIVMGFALCGATQPPAQNREAEVIWKSSCGYCHGKVPGAPELRGRHLPDALVLNFTRHGAAGMPVFHASEINDDELRGLTRWINRQPSPSVPR